MLAKNAKLNPKLFDRDVERMGPRDGFSVGLVLAADQNANVVGLCADLRESVRMEAFAQKYPERYIEVGVAEQNMAGVAAGLGVSGKIPYIASFATFSPGRNWEQLRTTVAYNDSNVKIAGHHAGLATGEDGATHQALEDIAIMRALPNMRIVVPCDAMEAKKATAAAAKIWGPMYLRFSRAPVPVMTTEATKFVPGKAYLMWETPKPQAVIIGAGAILFEALQAARELEKEKVNVLVLNSHTIEPLDAETIVELAKKAGAVVTVEDHQIVGGLGGAVAELLAKKAPTPIEFVGVKHVFGGSGKPAELYKKYGLDVEDIVLATKRAVRRKR